MTQQTAKQTKTAQQQYAVGDKVRILGLSIFDADEIGKTGVVTNGDFPMCIGGFGAVVKLPNGYKRVYKYENIEKVAEHMTKKFNVGDTVRIVSTKGQPLRGFSDGDIVTVTSIRFCEKRGEYRYTVEKNGGEHRGYGGNETFELANVKPTQSTPKKKARLSALEAQVAELTAKVEALEKAGNPAVKLVDNPEAYWKGDYVGGLTDLAKSPNEQRKAIIAEAKSFVAKYEAVRAGEPNKTLEGTQTARIHFYEAEFAVKDSKVAAVIYRLNSGRTRQGKPSEIGRSKCAPDDVFNADIGKAIALGRALGLDVKRFEQAVKPTITIGQIIDCCGMYSGKKTGKRVAVTGIRSDGNPKHADGTFTSHYVITDDTDAQY